MFKLVLCTVKNFSLNKLWSLTALVGVYVANYNVIFETTTLCIEEFIEKMRSRFLVLYELLPDLKE